jgi:hypothetical protein
MEMDDDDGPDSGPVRIVGRAPRKPEVVCPPKLSTSSADAAPGAESVQPKETDVVAGRAVDGEVGHDLAPTTLQNL